MRVTGMERTEVSKKRSLPGYAGDGGVLWLSLPRLLGRPGRVDPGSARFISVAFYGKTMSRDSPILGGTHATMT